MFRTLNLRLLVGALVGTVLAVAAPVMVAAAHTERPAPHARTIAACPTDEGADGQGIRPCAYDARHQGNGLGQSFLVTRDGHTVPITHARAHQLVFGGIR